MIFLYTNGALANQRTRINQFIKAPEVRVIDQTGENLGIKPLQEALTLAQNAGLDLIEIAPTAKPPVVRIMDLGKFQYQLDKEAQKAKKEAREVEVKGIRVRLGTGAHDLALKAKKTEEFMRQGNRVQIQLTLRGRQKNMTKTNKSVQKRIRVTKTGKILKRLPHQNHFSAKKRRVKQLGLTGWKEFDFGKSIKNRYLPQS